MQQTTQQSLIPIQLNTTIEDSYIFLQEGNIIKKYYFLQVDQNQINQLKALEEFKEYIYQYRLTEDNKVCYELPTHNSQTLKSFLEDLNAKKIKVTKGQLINLLDNLARAIYKLNKNGIFHNNLDSPNIIVTYNEELNWCYQPDVKLKVSFIKFDFYSQEKQDFADFQKLFEEILNVIHQKIRGDCQQFFPEFIKLAKEMRFNSFEEYLKLIEEMQKLQCQEHKKLKVFNENFKENQCLLCIAIYQDKENREDYQKLREVKYEFIKSFTAKKKSEVGERKYFDEIIIKQCEYQFNKTKYIHSEKDYFKDQLQDIRQIVEDRFNDFLIIETIDLGIQIICSEVNTSYFQVDPTTLKKCVSDKVNEKKRYLYQFIENRYDDYVENNNDIAINFHNPDIFFKINFELEIVNFLWDNVNNEIIVKLNKQKEDLIKNIESILNERY